MTTVRAQCSAPQLDPHLDDAGDGIDRHVAVQRDALTRQIISERQRLIQRAATFGPNNDDKLAGLAEATPPPRPGTRPHERRARRCGNGRCPLGYLAYRHRPATRQR
jgi:hypothetical protein